ncbi:CRTAC1 family protein [Paludibaculum fermentans]|uniref:CRTAC1 family protein n=1 Tax=Paludibaculum fermentans TaxID=1473598 RepID=A0A7S7NPT3_PALFE|nr:CRTAC1 family protein [Paludibaculum fermentans]
MRIWSTVAIACLALGAQPQAPFLPVAQELPFRLNNAATPEKHQIETVPGGVALLDYDGDGKLDIFLVNGAPQPSLKKSAPQWFNRLYRNLGNFRFEDVTLKAGLSGEGYGMGAAAGDFDNDGHTDLLVTSVGFSRLYRNRGDGTFEDVTAKAGIPATGWPISAGWLDYDNDGFLDLFIVNYCHWDPATEPFCGDAKAGFRTYCHPKSYRGLPNTLLHNKGNGTFTDVSGSSGIGARLGKGMAVAFADYNGDGRLDIAVLNDTTPNLLYRNEGGGRFTEVGMASGIAIMDDGKVVSSMGADFRDIDNDGRPDLFLTALANETFPLFRNLGNGLFQDVTYRSRIGAATLAFSGWSTGIYDFNNDGWKDIFVAAGDVQDNTELFSDRASKQQNQLLLNRGNMTFDAIAFGSAAQHRGAAFGDLDGDGRVDAVVSKLNGPPSILKNTMDPAHHWIAFQLTGTSSNRDAIGAVLKIVAGDRAQYNHVTTAVGYLSSSEKTVRFGLGKSIKVESVEITWPGGMKQSLSNLDSDRIHAIKQP